MGSPSDRVYTDSHEWLKLDGDEVTIGLTQFAADQLTDVTYVEMKPAGTTIEGGESLGEVESVKTTSDVYSAVPGEIVAVNEKLESDPSLVNSDPFGEGWLVRIKSSDTSGLDSCMDAETYDREHAN